eukprot:GILK01005996.1.p1 GENE.GILK01005996.1~~GILK01005996.1.p1  ORF type:complete len:420 (-),score=56.94 GILK01005996.1:418-1635(-)
MAPTAYMAPFALFVLFHMTLSAQATSFTFNALQYNVFGRQHYISSDGQEERLSRIPTAISNLDQLYAPIDVINFCEAFVASDRKELLANLAAKGWPYATSILDDSNPFTSLVNGGVVLVSKWPIVRQDQMVYRHDCVHSDCLAAKGAMYSRIQKTVNGTSKIFNVFSTHMQAWDDSTAIADRKQQLQQLHDFVGRQHIDPSEPVIFLGDFNTDFHRHPEEVTMMKEVLQASIPAIVDLASLQYTSDPTTNQLVGRDGAASSNGCSAEYEATGTCSCCYGEWLDYSLWAAAYQQPLTPPSLQVIMIKTSPVTVKWDILGHTKTLTDLSDHYPVLGRYEFAVSGEPLVQDGCKSSADCHFRWGYCYCDGNGCTYNGAKINGWDVGRKHAVNDNCKYDAFKASCACRF